MLLSYRKKAHGISTRCLVAAQLECRLASQKFSDCGQPTLPRSFQAVAIRELVMILRSVVESQVPKKGPQTSVPWWAALFQNIKTTHL